MSICTSCPLSSNKQIAGRGPVDAKVIVVGEYPDKNAEYYSMAFHPGKSEKEGPSAAVLRAFQAIGLNPAKDIYWAYALRCNPYKKAKSAKASDIRACNHNLNQELTNVTSPIIMAMGPIAVQSVISTKGGVTGNRLGWHNITLGSRPRLAMATLSPFQLERNSLFTAEESVLVDKKGNSLIEVDRDKRWSPFGSGPWFFKKDMFKLRDKLKELNLL
jgi:uracil-DNA glycosylase family 4